MICKRLIKEKFNCDFIDGSDTMQKKIANCGVLHHNYIVVIGKKEVESNIINVRNPKMVMSLNDFADFLKKQNPKIN